MAIRPAERNIEFFHGTYGSQAVIAVTPKDKNRVPIPLQGCDIELIASYQHLSIKKTISNGGLTVDLTTSRVAWQPTDAEVDEVPTGAKMRYAFRLIFEDGVSSCTFLRGFFVGDDPIR